MARSGTVKTVSKDDAQKRVIDSLRKGATVAEAMKLVKRTEETYKSWRKTDSVFKAAVDDIRQVQARSVDDDRAPVPDFETFCREDLKQPLYPHQLRMLDVLNGEEPRDFHAAMRFAQGRKSRVIINVPPEHAKSTTFTVNWVVWMIHKDPNIRIAIVSEGKQMAADFVYEIKNKLTSDTFREMHLKYAPDGGWKDPDQSWREDRIYVQGKGDGQKDPTVQALGINSAIYGKRIDVLILDDTVSTKNVGEIAKQVRWLTKMALSRLPSADVADWEHDDAELQNRVPGIPYGTCALLGTRVASQDLYQHLRDEFLGRDGSPLWTYFSQPAILERDGDTPAEWLTLWPHTITVSGFTRPMWGGDQLADKMDDLGAADEWELVYQQADVAENADFPAPAVDCAVNKQRFHGNMVDGAPGHREGGMAGLYVIAGYDPAASGHTAMVVLGVDRQTNKCWVLDIINKKDMGAAQVQTTIQTLTEKYGIKEWVIEVNAMNRYVSQDPAIVQFLRARGVRIRAHTTGVNKTDPDFGIKSIAPWFLSCGEPTETSLWRRTPATSLIDLPNTRICKASGELVSQLVTWRPQAPKTQKTDIVMALWFAIIAARDYLGIGKGKLKSHAANPWLTKRDAGRQHVVNLAKLREERMANAG